MNTNDISRDMALAHPRARPLFSEVERQLELDYRAGRMPVLFKPFEIWRSPARQEELFKRGTSRARAWESAHQYGLACDFVPWSPDAGWHWDVPEVAWAKMHELVGHYGLLSDIKWDPAHVEHRWFRELRRTA